MTSPGVQWGSEGEECGGNSPGTAAQEQIIWCSSTKRAFRTGDPEESGLLRPPRNKTDSSGKQKAGQESGSMLAQGAHEETLADGLVIPSSSESKQELCSSPGHPTAPRPPLPQARLEEASLSKVTAGHMAREVRLCCWPVLFFPWAS